MARRRHFIRLLRRLPEARNSPIRDTQHQAQPFTRDFSEHPRERLHGVQRDDRSAKTVDGAVPGAGFLEVTSRVFSVQLDYRAFEIRGALLAGEESTEKTFSEMIT